MGEVVDDVVDETYPVGRPSDNNQTTVPNRNKHTAVPDLTAD